MHYKCGNKISSLGEVLAACSLWGWAAQQEAVTHRWSVQSLSSSENFLFHCCKATKNGLFYRLRLYSSAVSSAPKCQWLLLLQNWEMYSKPSHFPKRSECWKIFFPQRVKCPTSHINSLKGPFSSFSLCFDRTPDSSDSLICFFFIKWWSMEGQWLQWVGWVMADSAPRLATHPAANNITQWHNAAPHTLGGWDCRRGVLPTTAARCHSNSSSRRSQRVNSRLK